MNAYFYADGLFLCIAPFKPLSATFYVIEDSAFYNKDVSYFFCLYFGSSTT